MTPLRKRMTEELQLRNLSPITAAVYLKAVERFAKYFRQPPDRLGAEEVRQWLLYLINDRKVAAASLQVHRAALRFLYVTTLKQPWFDDVIPWPKRIPSLPDVIAAGDVAAILNATNNLKHWTIIAALYATGIRIGELIRSARGRYRQQADGHPYPSGQRAYSAGHRSVSGPARAASDLLPPV